MNCSPKNLTYRIPRTTDIRRTNEVVNMGGRVRAHVNAT